MKGTCVRSDVPISMSGLRISSPASEIHLRMMSDVGYYSYINSYP